MYFTNCSRLQQHVFYAPNVDGKKNMNGIILGVYECSFQLKISIKIKLKDASCLPLHITIFTKVQNNRDWKQFVYKIVLRLISPFM